MDIKNITVIGLGAMGTPIATFLLRADYNVTGFDIIGKQMSNLVRLGLNPAQSPKEATKGANLIMLSLPNWDIIREVVEGREGVLGGSQKGQIIVDASTVPPWETKAMAERLAKRGIEWMDAPISGSAAQAMVGNMVFMVGGKKSVFKKVKPVLDKIGKKTVYVGKNGDAAMLKLVVNQTLFLNQASAIEGFVLGLKAGLDPDVMLGNFKAKGPVWLSIKDLGLALESAKRLGVALPMAGLYQQLLLNAHYIGWDRSDATVVMKIYEQLAGIKRKAKISPSRRGVRWPK